VSASAEQFQHATSIDYIGGFAEDVAVADDAGIGAEHDERIIGCVFRLVSVPYGYCFFFSETPDVSCRGFIGKAVFVEICGGHGKLEACLRKKFAAAWRG
jgi:hypothetical protein